MVNGIIEMASAESYMDIDEQIAYLDKVFCNVSEYIKVAVEDAYAKGLHDGSIEGIEEAYEEGFIAGQESVMDILR